MLVCKTSRNDKKHYRLAITAPRHGAGGEKNVLTKKECKEKSDAIKRDVESQFPGYVVKRVIVKPNQNWRIEGDIKKSLPNFYHLYPGLAHAQADDQIALDMGAIVKRHLPDTALADFDQNAHDGPRHTEIDL